MLLASSSGVASAQTTSQAVAATSQPQEVEESLQGIEGVRPGMTVDQLVDIGSKAVTAGRLDEGRKVLLAATARDTMNLRALSALAYAYERSAERARGGEADAATLAQADRFIEQAVDVYQAAGNQAIDQGRLDVAEPCFNRILLHQPANSKALLGLARIYAATERRIQALDRYKDYLYSSEGKKDARAHLEVGELYLDGTYWRLAMDQLARARELNPNDPDVDMALARAHQKADRMDEAMAAAKEASRKAPGRAKYHNLLAELHLVRGDGEQASIESLRAIESARKNLNNAPDSTALLKELSQYYGTHEKAFRLLINEGKANPVVRVDLARAIQEHAAVDRMLALREALKVLSDVSGDARDDARLLEELAHVQQALGLSNQVRETCRRLLQVDPNNAAATRILGEIEAASAK
ncbi:MAG TPA: tetratricopeptide repeat protein [Phycisphaerae bacterium]|nr:tetratricopeptide repeat protein [Phycisphaerae bacterium]